MKSIVALFALAGSASAFAPVNTGSRSITSSLKASALDGMIGSSVENGNKIFDPLNLSEKVPADFARAAELANGRSAMLASVGWFAPKVFGVFDSTDVTTTDPIKAIAEADPQWWAQFIVFCGVAEAAKYRASLNGKTFTGPGEPFLDYLKLYPKDQAGREAMHLKELKNGRLAMIAVAAYLSNYFIPGAVPGMPAGF
jgi:hypothetical protein